MLKIRTVSLNLTRTIERLP